MIMIWNIFKKTGTDAWDEMLYMIIFNLIWLVGTVLVLPHPFVTFALVYIVHDIGEMKGIKLSKFFGYGRAMLKPAYIWGGVNLAVLVALGLNIMFYQRFQAQWAGLLQVLFISLIMFWLILQLITLALYPRLVEPSFKLALRNAAVLVGKNPTMILVLIGFLATMIVISLVFPAVIFLITFSMTAVFTNNLVGALVKKAIDEQGDAG